MAYAADKFAYAADKFAYAADKFAYVWLLMKGDSYLPGIYTSIYSVKAYASGPADFVVMVTPDVSANARAMLEKLAIVVQVSYLSFLTKELKTEKQRKLYKEWASVSYTKWQCLNLPYKKILLLDGDVIAQEDISHLFTLQAPAAPFSSPFVKPLGRLPDYMRGERGADGYLRHAAPIGQRSVSDALTQGGMLLTASTVLLEPSKKDFAAYCAMVKKMEPFGFNCHSMADEQSIAYYYSCVKQATWHNIHQRYNLIAWKEGFLDKKDKPAVIHYFSDLKPWQAEWNKYADIIIWYKMAARAIHATGITAKDIALRARDVEQARAHD